MTRAALIGLLIATLTWTASPVRGQGPTTAAIEGRVRDGAGVTVAGASVTLVGNDGSPPRATRTGAAGEFRFPLLPPGEYRLQVEQEGYLAAGSTVWAATAAEVRVDLALAPTDGSVADNRGVDVVATVLVRPAGAVLALADAAIDLPLGPRGEFHELARLSPALDEWLGFEGLPASLSTMLIDGTPFRPAAHPLARRAPFQSAVFPVNTFRAGAFALNGLDADWPGAAGAVLGAQSWTGASETTVGARLRWSGDAFPGASSLSSDVSGFTDVQAGALVLGALDGGRARVALGGQLSRDESPRARAWPGTETARALTAAAAEAGVSLADPTRAQTPRADAFALFGRLDWDAAPRHRLEASAHVAGVPSVRVPAGAPLAPWSWGPTLEGVDVVAGAALHSTFGDALANLARVGVTHSARRAGDTDPVATTLLVQEGLGFGSAARASESEETLVHLRSTLQHHAGPHTLSAGATLTFGGYRYEHRENAGGAFFFGSTDLLRARQGVSLRAEGPSPLAEWNATDGGWYAQDHWRVRPGLDLLVGALLERRSLPELDAPRDREWLNLSGIANDAVESPGWRLGSRVGATWDVAGDGRWTLDVAAGTHYDRFDPLLVAQWRYDAVGVRVRRVVGAVAWPEPGGGGAPQRTLTVLAPGFDAPRTARVTAGLTHRLSPGTVLDVRAVTRRTEGLPRRRDLNVLPLPTARDQYGRGLYGTLAKQAALLAALPGTGRRFAGYDEVVGVAADGWSEHRGVNLGVEHAAGDLMSLTARYAFGRTTDDWFGGGWGAPPPAGFEEGDWLEARSDFDVPHRLVAGATVAPAPELRLSAFYRYASGHPFTPGFRAGVDANGDGTFGNDPAFVDPGLPGMTALLARWDCLEDAAGRFVERNACRGGGSHDADMKAEWSGARLGSAVATLTLEVFNLFDSAPELPDAALYLVDPAAGLLVDSAARRVTVPLLVNPAFGEPLDYPQPGRLLRLGLSITW